MAKIRDDLVGITIVRVGTQDLILKAGDTIPEGASVGDHLTAKSGDKTDKVKKTSEPATIPPKAGPGSGVKAWREYSTTQAAEAGLNIDIPEDATKADIIEALESAGIPTE